MLARYKRKQEDEQTTRKRYHQIGKDACKNGLDRNVADDFNVQYRPFVRQGWDEQNANDLFTLVNALSIGGNQQSRSRRKFSV